MSMFIMIMLSIKSEANISFWRKYAFSANFSGTLFDPWIMWTIPF